MEVTHYLAGGMLFLGKRARSIDEGIEQSKETIKNGSAYKKLLQLVEVQGGDVMSLENLERYPLAVHSVEVRLNEGGYVAGIDPLELGLTSITLGAGRQKVDDVIDPKAGIVLKKKVGDPVADHEIVAVLYTDREDVLESARTRIANAFRTSPTQPKKKKLILSYIDKTGVRTWE
jgi:pyrimidine-nucleoside phosphorylase